MNIMKKFLLMIVLIAGVASVNAQTMYVSSEKRQTCYWNEALSKFSGCGEIESYESLFKKLYWSPKPSKQKQ